MTSGRTLLPEHLAHLHGRGLTDAAIVAAHLDSVTGPDEARRLNQTPPGWSTPPVPAIVMPVFGADGAPTGVSVLRPDQPRNGAKYIGPHKVSPRIYFPPIVAITRWRDVRVPLFITEGILKSLRVAQAGYACAGAMGVWLCHDVPVKRHARTWLLHPDLRQVIQPRRIVVIVFDSDAAEKPGVAQARQQLVEMLRAAGAVPVVIDLPSADDGSKLGADDYIQLHGEAAFGELVDEALARGRQERRRLARPLSLSAAEKRLHAALDRANDWAQAETGRIAMLTGTTGVGKTRAILERWKRLRSTSGIMLQPSHKAIDERVEEAQAMGLAVDHVMGASRRCPLGTGVRAVLEALAARRWRVGEVVCHVCGARRRCVGRGRPGGRGGDLPQLGPHALADGELDTRGERVVVVDEMPGIVGFQRIEVRDVELLLLPHSVDPDLARWCVTRTGLAAVIAKAAAALQAQGNDLGGPYARRISGEALARRLADAAGGQQAWRDLVAAWSAEPAKLDKVPPPLGDAILYGKLAPVDWPRADTDEILDALVHAEVPVAERPTEYHVCMVVQPGRPRADGIRSPAAVWIECRWRRLARAVRDRSLVVLDATGDLVLDEVRASVGSANVRTFPVEVREKADPTRSWISTWSLSRRALFGGVVRAVLPDSADMPSSFPAISDRGRHAILLALAEAVPHEHGHIRLGIITHLPLMPLLERCVESIRNGDDDGEVPADIIAANAAEVLHELRALVCGGHLGEVVIGYYGGVRGSNRFRAVDALLLLGDPFPDVGATAEDARILGLPGARVISGRVQAEIRQAEGRARIIRRSRQDSVRVVLAGRAIPAHWPRFGVEHPPRGRPPSGPAVSAQQVVKWLRERLGVVSHQFVRLLATSPGFADFVAEKREQRIGASGIVWQ